MPLVQEPEAPASLDSTSQSSLDLTSQHEASEDAFSQSSLDPASQFSPSPDPASQAQSLFPWTFVKRLISHGSTEQLIAGVSTASSLLTDYETILRRFGDNPDVLDLVAAILRLQKEANPRGAVIGVVGSTGAGKSSIINAVLDEECLVPTNSMRACTAAITEISWNSDDDPAKYYTAEVEFIKAEDWKQELEVLFNDLVDANGQTPEDMTNPESQAGITLAKVRAVYPSLVDEDFLQGVGIVDDLLRDEKVNDILGVTMCLYADSASALQVQLRPFIDSKEKNRDGQKTQDDETTMSTWPLVNVVRIYTKAPVLRSGLILVDLPGVHDSNAARAAMADEYMKKCNAIWVVAPITRAVDDKSAQALMGVTFQRQLHLDGSYSHLTMICSKSDDISTTEVKKRLLADESWKLKHEALQVKVEQSEQLLHQNRAALDDIDQRVEIIDSTRRVNERRIGDLASALGRARGDDILVSPGKRPLDQPVLPRPKRVMRVHGADSEDSSDTDSDSENNQEVRMSKLEVKQELDSLRKVNKEQKDAKKTLKHERKPLVQEVKALEKIYQETLKAETRKMCIEFRNEYSRSAVQTCFKYSVQELDQDRFVEEDEDANELSQDMSYYDELASKLPVYCVSARAYMKLTGKLIEDEGVQGFTTYRDTEIPQLRQHALNIADGHRSVLCQRFLKEFLQILRSLVLQLLMEEKPLELEKELRRKELDQLTASMTDLKLELDAAEKKLINFTDDAQTSISRKLKHGVKDAKGLAEEVVTGWFRKKDQGGLAYMTFTAVCRRGGRYEKPGVTVDLNEDLVKPLKQAIARRWARLLNEKTPSHLEKFGRRVSTQLGQFRTNAENRRQLRKSAQALRALSELIIGYEQQLGDTETRKEFITEAHKEASRKMTPVITRHMRELYAKCLQETGKGCFKRMKALVSDHVMEHIDMFDLAADEVRSDLRSMFTELTEKRNHELIEQALNTIETMYKNLITGTKIFASLKEARDQLRSSLDGADDRFNVGIAIDVPMVDADTAHDRETDETRSADINMRSGPGEGTQTG